MAIAVLPDVHHPPVVSSLKLVVAPMQTPSFPLIIAGKAFTVTIAVAVQPVPSVYDTNVAPVTIAVTTPVLDPTVAITEFPLLQLPPVVVSLRFIVKPAHKGWLPFIADGDGLKFIILVLVAAQPVLTAVAV